MFLLFTYIYMCCVKKMMIGWRNVWSVKLRVQDQEEDQRGPGERLLREDCRARKMNKEDAIDRSKWRKMIKDVRWSGWVWVSECFFWYRPTRVVPYQRPLNGCVCVCECYLVAVSVLKWSDGDVSDPSIDSYSQMQPVCHSSRTLLAGIDW